MANTLTFANQTITDANIFGGISFTHDLNTGEEFSIGNTASASVTFVTDIQLPLYTKDAVNGTFTWTRDSVSRGRYYITEVTKQQGKYTVTAYDAMILADTGISALNLSFPLTVSALATAIATYLGCTVSGTVNNGSVSVSSLDESLTVRRLLGYVAEASGCSVKIDGADHLCFMYYASSGITVAASQYKELEVADYVCAAIDNVVIYGRDGSEQAVAGTGTNTLHIQGNPLLYEVSDTEAQTILTQVSGLAYAPFTCSMFEENGLEIGTTATFGATQSLVMHIESAEDGVIASSVGSDARAPLTKDAEAVANEAKAMVGGTTQHFWFKSTGSDTGAHIATTPKDTFEQTPSGGNLLATAAGVFLRDGLTQLASFTQNIIRLGSATVGHLFLAKITANDGYDYFRIRGMRDVTTIIGELALGDTTSSGDNSVTLRAYPMDDTTGHNASVEVIPGTEPRTRVFGSIYVLDKPSTVGGAWQAHSSAIGSVQESSATSVALSASAFKSVASLTLGRGTWVVSGAVEFKSTSTSGQRAAHIYNSTTDTIISHGHCRMNAASSSLTRCNAFAILQLDQSATIQLRGYSTVALSCDGSISAARIC